MGAISKSYPICNQVSRRLFHSEMLPKKENASSGHSGVRISNVVEEGQLEYVAVPEPTAGSSRSVESPAIGSKRKTSALSRQIARKSFDVVSPVNSPRKFYMDDPCLRAALDREASGSHPRSGRDRRAPPAFDFAKTKKNSIA